MGKNLHQLRLVVELIMYQGLYIPGGKTRRISSTNKYDSQLGNLRISQSPWGGEDWCNSLKSRVQVSPQKSHPSKKGNKKKIHIYQSWTLDLMILGPWTWWFFPYFFLCQQKGQHIFERKERWKLFFFLSGSLGGQKFRFWIRFNE